MCALFSLEILRAVAVKGLKERKKGEKKRRKKKEKKKKKKEKKETKEKEKKKKKKKKRRKKNTAVMFGCLQFEPSGRRHAGSLFISEKQKKVGS